MSVSKRKNAGLVFLVLGIAQFGGSFVLEISGLWAAGIGLMVLGAVLMLSNRGKSGQPK